MSTETSDSVNNTPPNPEVSGNSPPVESRPAPAFKHLARWLDWRAGTVLLLAAILLGTWRILASHAGARTVAPPEDSATPVAVTRVTRQDLYNEITIPAEFRPYLQVEVHAKVSGYVDEIGVDIGDPVKAGQLLAKLEVPELSDELARAKAAEEHAQADYKNAHQIFTRLVSVEKVHPNLVAQQELDAAEAKDATAQAAIAAAKAETEKYQTLISYTRITAPFDGIITRRYADPGSLIQAGINSDTQSRPLVRLSDNYRLRLDIPVSVDYISDVQPGQPVEIRVESLKGKLLTGTISRCSQKVDEDTRTMTAEIEVPNPKLELVPGMYASAVLKVDHRAKVLTVPTEAVASGKAPSVWLVDAEQKLTERPVTLGLETPTRYEVVSGLKEGDLVIIGSRSQIKPGQKVAPKLITSLAKE